MSGICMAMDHGIWNVLLILPLIHRDVLVHTQRLFHVTAIRLEKPQLLIQGEITVEWKRVRKSLNSLEFHFSWVLIH